MVESGLAPTRSVYNLTKTSVDGKFLVTILDTFITINSSTSNCVVSPQVLPPRILQADVGKTLLALQFPVQQNQEYNITLINLSNCTLNDSRVRLTPQVNPFAPSYNSSVCTGDLSLIESTQRIVFAISCPETTEVTVNINTTTLNYTVSSAVVGGVLVGIIDVIMLQTVFQSQIYVGSQAYPVEKAIGIVGSTLLAVAQKYYLTATIQTLNGTYKMNCSTIPISLVNVDVDGFWITGSDNLIVKYNQLMTPVLCINLTSYSQDLVRIEQSYVIMRRAISSLIDSGTKIQYSYNTSINGTIILKQANITLYTENITTNIPEFAPSLQQSVYQKDSSSISLMTFQAPINNIIFIYNDNIYTRNMLNYSFFYSQVQEIQVEPILLFTPTLSKTDYVAAETFSFSFTSKSQCNVNQLSVDSGLIVMIKYSQSIANTIYTCIGSVILPYQVRQYNLFISSFSSNQQSVANISITAAPFSFILQAQIQPVVIHIGEDFQIRFQLSDRFNNTIRPTVPENCSRILAIISNNSNYKQVMNKTLEMSEVYSKKSCRLTAKLQMNGSYYIDFLDAQSLAWINHVWIPWKVATIVPEEVFGLKQNLQIASVLLYLILFVFIIPQSLYWCVEGSHKHRRSKYLKQQKFSGLIDDEIDGLGAVPQRGTAVLAENSQQQTININLSQKQKVELRQMKNTDAMRVFEYEESKRIVLNNVDISGKTKSIVIELVEDASGFVKQLQIWQRLPVSAVKIEQIIENPPDLLDLNTNFVVVVIENITFGGDIAALTGDMQVLKMLKPTRKIANIEDLVVQNGTKTVMLPPSWQGERWLMYGRE